MTKARRIGKFLLIVAILYIGSFLLIFDIESSGSAFRQPTSDFDP